ncbi:tRNA (adenosine(37)-N6)-threonylcarbamoyltransferase complex dimerization subunit type 1 TsaB [Staphylococcus kloosii]|uniref:tRNA (adenosine(37)-N6)-threonylcarbamoyltransferase complex dimerization subunit type 1 TsaB n=1 Tax=Staphylococcus kloosii TaxID=29384 RepID=UPI0028A57FD3|nr:tRNA (adenosine(37)-N6)-threonylcarbamoyltransferase complex dimerization subunit type 1 TsaB [Staphylococcus kloosii]MDT3958459.1 tRNA (adenosine(37)-N6)-threonylcarbamoyltransferase complex dimerization subunit type 1 TsaB [Staphylococcus kloosii]
MNYLLIDTSNQPLSVAVMDNNTILAEINNDKKVNHSVQLMPAIISALEQANLTKQDIESIVVAEGPGSYTGLRIGVTVAKTLAYALNVSLYGVSSLAAVAATVQRQDRLIVPVFDARREAVYAGVYQYNNEVLETIMSDQYITIEDLLSFLHADSRPYVFVGADSEKLAHLLDSDCLPNLPQAHAMKSLISKPVNIHEFVPKYLKISEAERNWLAKQNNN